MNLSRGIFLLPLLLLVTSACNKTAPTQPNYSGAINAYYQAHPACLWSDERKFPVQAGTSDAAKTQGYDALVDAGLLTRTTSEKKIVIISKQENNYDLSSNGRAAWTADPNQPGYGNFCYGNRSVSSIDSSSPILNSDQVQPGTKVAVSYHFTMSGVPAWASAPETQIAFPNLKDDLSGVRTATDTLTETTAGWQVSTPSALTSNPSNPATPADGKIVQ